MDKIKLELSAKMLHFTIKAIDFKIADYEKRMQSEETSDDDFADMANDSRLLQVVRDDMAEQKKLQGYE